MHNYLEKLCKCACLALLMHGTMACIHVPQPDPTPLIQFSNLNDGVIEVEAEADTAYIEVASNRTWTARAVDPASSDAWAKLNLSGFRNLAGDAQKAVIPIEVAYNPDVTAGRSANFEIISKEQTATFTLRQKALVASLQVEAECDVENIGDVAGAYNVKVLCNTDWTAQIDEGGTAQVSLDKTEGNCNGEIVLSFGTNLDAFNTKHATLRVSAINCEDCVMAFTQKKSVPYVKASPLEGLDLRISSLGTTQDWYPLNIESNSEWTVSVKEGSTTVPTFSAASGTGNQTIYLTFPNNPSYEEEKKATVVVTALGDGGNSQELTFTQDNALTITLNFLNAEQTKTVNAFVTPISGKPKSLTAYDANGNAYKIKCGRAIELTSKDGFQFGNVEGDYMLLPIIPNRRLCYVYMIYSKTQYRSLMTSGGGSTVVKFNQYRLPAPNGTHMEVYLDETKTGVGKAYRIQSQPGRNENVGFKKLVLRYE